MDAVHDKLDEVVRLVESARAMPMSSSVMVHRGEVLDLLDELRALLPQVLDRAQRVLGDREAVVEEGRLEAQRLLERAAREQERMLTATEVHRQATAEAARLIEDARAQAATMQVQVDDYVDGKLATFELALTSTLEAVERGRAKIAGRSALDELSAGDPP